MKHNKYSDLKIVNFPEKLASFREGRITAPIYVRVKPINRCSHACHWCVYSDGTKRSKDRPSMHLKSGMHEAMDERDVMPFEKAIEILDDFREMGVKAVTYSGGGEPLIHPKIVGILQHTLMLGIDLSIITNGQSLMGERAEALSYARWVRVSMDYTSAEQMARSRNVPEKFFEMVLDNMASFAARKRPGCDLGVNFIVTRENFEGLVPFAKRLKGIGVENVRFSPVFVSDFLDYHRPIQARVEEQLREAQSLCDEGASASLSAPTEVVARAARALSASAAARFSVNSTYELESPSKSPVRKYTRCLYMQTVPVVGADLGVYACHNKAYDATGLIGSIKDRRFKELWYSEEARLVFEGLNPQCVCRHECANDSKNVHFLNLAGMHSDNFV